MCRGSGTIVNAVSASGLFRPSIIEDTSILLTNYYYIYYYYSNYYSPCRLGSNQGLPHPSGIKTAAVSPSTFRRLFRPGT